MAIVGCEAKVGKRRDPACRGGRRGGDRHRYGNFVLEVDWKALGSEMWDIGDLLPLRDAAAGRPAVAAATTRLNLRKDMEGNCAGSAGRHQ
jgi:hypothetical protein